MKTTIELSDALLSEAKHVASDRKETLRELFETALRRHLAQTRKSGNNGFKLRKHTFKGNGLQSGITEGDWTNICRRAYEGHGG